MGRSRRTLPEELLLLALDPATGTTAQPQSLDLGLAGAQLVELALAGRIAPDGDRIAVVVPRPTGDPTHPGEAKRIAMIRDGCAMNHL